MLRLTGFLRLDAGLTGFLRLDLPQVGLIFGLGFRLGLGLVFWLLEVKLMQVLF